MEKTEDIFIDESVLLPLVEIERIDLTTDGAQAAVLYLNRPDVLNALSWDLILELEAALHATANDDAISAILITGRGRAFSAGGDLKSYMTLQADPAAFARFIDDFHRTFSFIRSIPRPVVALVNGVTAAGGLELLLACDFAWASESARIGDLHLNYGQMGGGGVLALLPRAIGPARARELIFSARLLDAREALDWGIVNRVVPDDALLEAGIEFARGVAAKSRTAVAVAKDVLNTGFTAGTGVEDALRLERDGTCLYCATSPDSMEGLRAFSEKRPPRFAR